MSSPQRVFRSTPTTNSEVYINWLNNEEKTKEQFWKDWGIYDLIQLFIIVPKYNPNMIISLILFW